jgi:hypothetical protein
VRIGNVGEVIIIKLAARIYDVFVHVMTS